MGSGVKQKNQYLILLSVTFCCRFTEPNAGTKMPEFADIAGRNSNAKIESFLVSELGRAHSAQKMPSVFMCAECRRSLVFVMSEVSYPVQRVEKESAVAEEFWRRQLMLPGDNQEPDSRSRVSSRVSNGSKNTSTTEVRSIMSVCLRFRVGFQAETHYCTVIGLALLAYLAVTLLSEHLSPAKEYTRSVEHQFCPPYISIIPWTPNVDLYNLLFHKALISPPNLHCKQCDYSSHNWDCNLLQALKIRLETLEKALQAERKQREAVENDLKKLRTDCKTFEGDF